MFYFSLLAGTWREGLMHGKGIYTFSTGMFMFISFYSPLSMLTHSNSTILICILIFILMRNLTRLFSCHRRQSKMLCNSCHSVVSIVFYCNRCYLRRRFPFWYYAWTWKMQTHLW